MFKRRLIRAAVSVSVVCLFAGNISAQSNLAEESGLSRGALPDAPSALLVNGQGEISDASSTSSKSELAKKNSRIVKAGQQAVPLSSKDKFSLAVADRVSITAVASSAFSAGYGYWRDDVPHYGTNLPAYGHRFGAAYLKASSESILSYGVYASLFHDDPRYYVMGLKHKLLKRAVYAASRVVITRNDDGDNVVNWPKLAGVTSAAALTNTYYPDQDRRFGRTATSVLSSIGTTAGVNELHEFIGDALRLVFHKHRDDK